VSLSHLFFGLWQLRLKEIKLRVANGRANLPALELSCNDVVKITLAKQELTELEAEERGIMNSHTLAFHRLQKSGLSEKLAEAVLQRCESLVEAATARVNSENVVCTPVHYLY
jgi:hypothetical protein